MTLAGFTVGQQGATPDGLGYMSVQSPLTQSALQTPWYSLNFNLNLGTIGALAGEIGFTAGVTMAWSPSGSGAPQIYLGLKLPGSNGAKNQISIEGVLAITFKTIALLQAAPARYSLLLYNAGVSFLSKTFPSSGQINLVLFGDPSPEATNTTLGWYVAYAKSAQAAGGKPASGEATAGAAGRVLAVEQARSIAAQPAAGRGAEQKTEKRLGGVACAD